MACELCGLEFEQDAGASRFEVEGGGFAVIFAKDAGAHAQAERGGFVAGRFGNEGIEGASGDREFRTGVSYEDLHLVVFSNRFEADRFFVGGVESFDGVHGELETVEDGLADLLRIA
jgi:hypothetical protein